MGLLQRHRSDFLSNRPQSWRSLLTSGSLAGLMVLGLISNPASAAELRVTNPQEYAAAAADLEAGDTIILANGEWRDFEIVLRGEGRAGKPIRLTAEEKGKVVISGKSNLRLAGEYLEVSGLVFKNGYTPTQSVISFRVNKDELANHSRVTQTVIDNFNNPERFEPDYWVAIYGKHNRFDHNHLEGKRNKGVTLAVRLDSEASRENHHRIDHNYFGPRPTLGSNGGETLRIGTSHYSRSDSLTLVENNYFDRCDGEVEIVSNKSGANIFRGNVFYQSRGTLTLRHGHGNLIENNVFLGNGVDHTGGIRVINRSQTVRNNYLEGLTGYRFGGGLVVMNGVPNSPINRYDPVENALIERNSLINIDHIELAAGSDAERSAAPTDSRFSANLVYHENGEPIFAIHDDIDGIQFQGNVAHAAAAAQIGRGMEARRVKLRRADNGLLYPLDRKLQDVGVSRDLQPLLKSQTGVDWYPKNEAQPRFGGGQVIDVPVEDGALARAVEQAQAGDILQLAAGDHMVKKILQIDKALTFRAAGDVQVEFERPTLFEIVDGGSLYLKGLHISGASAPDYVSNSVIRTSRYSMLRNYEIRMEDIEVSDLDVNRFFNVVSVAKGTMADSIEIRNSRFSDISGAILKLDVETDDYGIFNADYVTITDSTFERVQGALVNLYRGGTDESTFGPHFTLSGSLLNDVGNGKRNKSGASIYLHGVQVASMENNEFRNSPAVRVEHTVAEPRTRFVDNTLLATPLPEVTELFHKGMEHTAIIRDNTLRPGDS